MHIDAIGCYRCGDVEGYIVKKYGNFGKFIGICEACELRTVWQGEEE